MIKKNRILLFYTANIHSWPFLPNSVLALSGPLLKRGYNPIIIDTGVVDCQDFDTENVLAIGVSAYTGSGIVPGIKASKYAKKKNKDILVVWGGPHPTAIPDQVVNENYIDVVCRNDSEDSFVKLLDAYREGKPLHDIDGISYKKGEKIIHNKEAAFVDLDSWDRYPYDLLDISNYPCVKEKFYLQTSRGCPYKCTFCSYDPAKRWRGRSAENVVDDIKWVMERFSPKEIVAADANFFTSKKRVQKICEGILKEEIHTSWTGTCRFDYFVKYKDEFIDLLKKSGCCELSFGAESASDDILSQLKKQINYAMIVESIKKAKKHNIGMNIFFMGGFPNEKDSDVEKSLSLIDWIRDYMPKTNLNGFFIYMPFPGSELFNDAVKLGFNLPKSLSEWGMVDIDMVHTNQTTPWLTKKKRDRLETISAIVRFRFFDSEYRKISLEQKKKRLFGSLFLVKMYELVNVFFNLSANFRWRIHNFDYAYEWKLWVYARDKLLKQV